MAKNHKEAGFSMIELIIVVVIALVIAAFAVPSFIRAMQNFRTSGDALSLNGEILLAKMRAAANFTRSRVYFDLTAGSFRTELWDKTAATWTAESVGAPQNLARDVTFGFGGVSTDPDGNPIAQAPPCTDDTGLNPGGGADIADTACMMFNSRGFPVNNAGAPTSQDAIYITDGTSAYVVRLSASGLTRTWRTDVTYTNWNLR